MEVVRSAPTPDAEGSQSRLPYARLDFPWNDDLSGGVLIHSLPVTLGRNKSTAKNEGQFVTLDAKTVSRKHAVISWDKNNRKYRLDVVGRNPATVAQRKVHKNSHCHIAVSYTHLTLPTIYSV